MFETALNPVQHLILRCKREAPNRKGRMVEKIFNLTLNQKWVMEHRVTEGQNF